MSYQAYMAEVRRELELIENTQGEAIRKAATAMADVIGRGAMIHIFGPGHAHLLSDEMVGRAGGLVAINQICDPDLMPYFGPQVALLENLEGYGVIVFDTHDTQPGEAIIIVSMAGLAANVIDVALAAKRAGLTVIGITGVEYSKAGRSFHSSGKRLFEVADIVIDNFSPVGEAGIKLEGLFQPVAPTTTVTSAFILNALVAETAAIMLKRGVEPPIGWSANVEMPAEKRKQLLTMWGMYRERARKRRMPTVPLREVLAISKGYTAKPW